MESRRGWIQLGNFDDIDATIKDLERAYQEGARWVSSYIENWHRRSTVEEARRFCKAIESLDGLSVLQWNSHLTWETEALPILQAQKRLTLAEMIYPTARGKFPTQASTASS